MKSTGKILTAIVAGAAIGAIVGILFAPDKGSETRKKISEEGKKLAEDVKDKFRKGKEKLNELKKDFERTVKEKADEIA